MIAPRPLSGLSEAEARKRLHTHGPNALPEKRPEALWRRFLHQFKSPLIYIERSSHILSHPAIKKALS